MVHLLLSTGGVPVYSLKGDADIAAHPEMTDRMSFAAIRDDWRALAASLGVESD